MYIIGSIVARFIDKKFMNISYFAKQGKNARPRNSFFARQRMGVTFPPISSIL